MVTSTTGVPLSSSRFEWKIALCIILGFRMISQYASRVDLAEHSTADKWAEALGYPLDVVEHVPMFSDLAAMSHIGAMGFTAVMLFSAFALLAFAAKRSFAPLLAMGAFSVHGLLVLAIAPTASWLIGQGWDLSKLTAPDIVGGVTSAAFAAVSWTLWREERRGAPAPK